MVSRSRAVELLLELIQEMAAERQNRWGWRSEVAQELGIHASAVGKLVNGDRDGISLQTVERVSQRSERYRTKLAGAETHAAPIAARAADVIETRNPRRDAEDPGHWLKLTLDAWGFTGRRREAMVAQLEAAAPPLQPQTVRALVDMWIRIEALEGASRGGAVHDSEARPRRGLEKAKPRKRLEK